MNKKAPSTQEGAGVSRSLPFSAAPTAVGDVLGGNAVYRSLAVASSAADGIRNPITIQEVPKSKASSASASSVAATSSSAPTTNTPKAFPHLPVPLKNYPLPVWHTWIGDHDEEKIVNHVGEALATAQVEYTLCRETGSCRFQCKAFGERQLESCAFDVNIWDTQNETGANGRFLLEAERRAGCPFFYANVVSHTMLGSRLGGSPLTKQKTSEEEEGAAAADGAAGAPSAAPSAAPSPAAALRCFKNRRFMAPKLPAECADNGEGIRSECVERVIQCCLSNDYEERLQGCRVLADLLARDAHCVAKFKQARCVERVSGLLADADPVVQRAARQIVASLG